MSSSVTDRLSVLRNKQQALNDTVKTTLKKLNIDGVGNILARDDSTKKIMHKMASLKSDISLLERHASDLNSNAGSRVEETERRLQLSNERIDSLQQDILAYESKISDLSLRLSKSEESGLQLKQLCSQMEQTIIDRASEQANIANLLEMSALRQQTSDEQLEILRGEVEILQAALQQAEKLSRTQVEQLERFEEEELSLRQRSDASAALVVTLQESLDAVRNRASSTETRMQAELETQQKETRRLMQLLAERDEQLSRKGDDVAVIESLRLALADSEREKAALEVQLEEQTKRATEEADLDAANHAHEISCLKSAHEEEVRLLRTRAQADLDDLEARLTQAAEEESSTWAARMEAVRAEHEAARKKAIGDLAASRDEVHSLREELSKGKADLQRSQEEARVLREQIVRLAKESEALRSKAAGGEDAAQLLALSSELRAALQREVGEKEGLVAERDAVVGECEALKSEIQSLKTDFAALTEEVGVLREEREAVLASAERTALAQEELVAACETRLHEAAEQVNIMQARVELTQHASEEDRKRADAAEDAAERLREELQILKEEAQRLTTLAGRPSTTDSQTSKGGVNMGRLEEALRAMKGSLETAEWEKDSVLINLSLLETAMEAQTQQYHEMEAKFEDASLLLQRGESRCAFLEGELAHKDAQRTRLQSLLQEAEEELARCRQALAKERHAHAQSYARSVRSLRSHVAPSEEGGSPSRQIVLSPPRAQGGEASPHLSPTWRNREAEGGFSPVRGVSGDRWAGKENTLCLSSVADEGVEEAAANVLAHAHEVSRLQDEVAKLETQLTEQTRFLARQIDERDQQLRDLNQSREDSISRYERLIRERSREVVALESDVARLQRDLEWAKEESRLLREALAAQAARPQAPTSTLVSNPLNNSDHASSVPESNSATVQVSPPSAEAAIMNRTMAVEMLGTVRAVTEMVVALNKETVLLREEDRASRLEGGEAEVTLWIQTVLHSLAVSSPEVKEMLKIFERCILALCKSIRKLYLV